MDVKKRRVNKSIKFVKKKYIYFLNQQRDLLLEFRLSQWIEKIISETKPAKISFEDWIADGTVLSKYFLILCFKN